ncbi:MAG: DUF3450 domain-containing protein, partial [Proteobacteria bacterium]|nr:DUF3450 domain-containing protein [Pseudomonadota bacterium]
LAEIRKQPKQDFESLKVALPDQVAALNGLSRSLEATKAAVKADAPLPETFVSLGHLGMTAEAETVDATMMAALWSQPLNVVQGPVYTDEGAVLFLAQNESGGKLTREHGIRMAARDLLASRKAQDAAKDAADKALAALVAGKTPDQVQGMPEMLTEGPVNPLKGQPNLITRELATELWKIETPGKVLPRVIVDDVMGKKVFKIMFLESRKFPVREDFDSQESTEAVSTLSPRSAFALDLILKDSSIKISEKFRRLSEALMVEAEYGGTLDVYPETIGLGGKEIQMRIFRLGRIALFCQSLDRKDSGIYDVSDGKWQVLPGRYNKDMDKAMEIGSKRRPAELVTLPLGRMAVK